MDAILTALADPARWRLVTLLAERPRSVGLLARLADARQPQTTKHLQALERAGVVTSRRTGQRRVYALRPESLRELAAALHGLADAAEGAGTTFDRHGVSLQAELLAAHGPGWADGRSFAFRRTLSAPPETVWRHLTDPALLAHWWTPHDLRVSELVFDARPGGRVVLEYRDVEDPDATGGSDTFAGRAEGVVDDVVPGERLAYRSSPLLPDGGVAFTSHVEYLLAPAAGGMDGTDLEVRYRITDSTVDSADFVAGIEIGVGQTLDTLAAVLTTHVPEDAENTDTTPGRTP